MESFIALHTDERSQRDLRRMFGFTQDYSLPEFIKPLVHMHGEDGLDLLIDPTRATTLRIVVPDTNGNRTHVALGFPNLGDYNQDSSYQGAVIGRNANRIQGGTYIDPESGEKIYLDANNNGNNLHGGRTGWNRGDWRIRQLDTMYGLPCLVLGLEDSITHSRFSGDVEVNLIITVKKHNCISYKFEAVPSKTTVINPTIHTYFNLNGVDTGTTVHNHHIQINATHYLQTENLIPTGRLVEVAGTRYDFAELRRLGNQFGEQGFDDCLVIQGGGELELRAYSPKTGIIMVASSDPSTKAAQFYTGHFLNGSPAQQYGGLCWEPGTIIDAPNQPELCRQMGLSAFVKAGEMFKRTISYEFRSSHN